MFIILSLSSINAIIISEVESDPQGTDSKNEWIELYSQEEINGEYILVNNDAGEVYDNEDSNQIKVHFNFQGYYIYIFGTQWLDNSDEKVYLYDEYGTLIDSTNLFDDGGNSNYTWQKCEDTWIFEEETRGVENCIVEEPESPEENQTQDNETQIPEEGSDSEENNKTQDSQDKEETSSEEVEDSTNDNEYTYGEFPIKEKTNSEEETPITGSIIKLDSKDIKSSESTKELSKSNFVTVVLGFVVILLLFLIVSQRYKHNKKNEFRE
jgi:hypothetical protein